MAQTAALLANGLFGTPFAKTSYGMLRGPSRYKILGVIDPACAGRDAGEILDGQPRGIPVAQSLEGLVSSLGVLPDVCVVGVATVGGVLPEAIRDELVWAAKSGVNLVNGMHELLSEDLELQRLCSYAGSQIVDIRRPKPVDQLRFWTGEALSMDAVCVPVLGTDCAVGKRTTAIRLWKACQKSSVATELIYTGQTGWLQGFDYGFVLDATPNDFVCGELEGALLQCQRETNPELIFIEGQSSLRNPSGPCGSELIVSSGAKGVVLQHVPGREFFADVGVGDCRIPPLSEEIELIRLLGSEVWAVTINPQGLEPDFSVQAREALSQELDMPVVDPLEDGVDEVVATILERSGLAASS